MKNYEVLSYYTDLTSLKPVFSTFEDLVMKYLPKVYKILQKFKFDPSLYATSWFLAFYIVVLPFNTVLRIMDIFLLEGFKIIYRIGLTILKIKKKKILQAKSMDDLMLELRNFSSEVWSDEDFIIKTAVSFKFSGKYSKKLEKKHENKKNDKKSKENK